MLFEDWTFVIVLISRIGFTGNLINFNVINILDIIIINIYYDGVVDNDGNFVDI